MPNQSPTLMRLIAAKTADMPQADVTVHTTFLGGGFGRRAEVDLVRQAVTCALAMPERPVQVLWSREEDIRHDYYRPMALARWRAELDVSDGALKLASVAKRQVGQSPADQFPARLGLPEQGQPEGNAVENPPYGFPFYRLEAIVPDGSVPVGFWRSVGHSHTAFFDESFVDEMALALKKDPFEFRRELLAGQAAARQGAGDGGEGGGLGLAAAGRDRGAASRCAPRSARSWRRSPRSSVADGKTLQVKRVTCAIDCGPVINPAIVRAQMESGIVYGLSAALHGEITLADGAVEQSNFTDYEVVQPGRCAGHVGAHRRQRRRR